jgi:tetratricopeptide (TPR) repeat protein
MKVRYIRLAVLFVALSVAAAGCGRYSISNIRSLKAFQDANALYKKAEYKQAIGEYERSLKFNPELGFAYFFLGNSYDNLYKPARKGEPENDANLNKAAENYRLAIQKLSAATDPKEIEIRKLTYEYLIAAYGPDKLNDFSKAEPIAKELIASEPNDPVELPGPWPPLRGPGPIRRSRSPVQEGRRPPAEGGSGLSAARRVLQSPGQLRKDDGSLVRARRTRAEQTPRRGTRSAGSTRDNVFRRQEVAAEGRARLHDEGASRPEDKALALNPEYLRGAELQEHPAPTAGASSRRIRPKQKAAAELRPTSSATRHSKSRRSRTRALARPDAWQEGRQVTVLGARCDCWVRLHRAPAGALSTEPSTEHSRARGTRQRRALRFSSPPSRSPLASRLPDRRINHLA